VHGGRGEALTEKGEMEGEGDKGKKEEALDPIMMDDDQIKWIMVTTGKDAQWSTLPIQGEHQEESRSHKGRLGK
jgi:hypothetical protein